MPKVIAVILSFMLVFSLTACGNKDTAPVLEANYYPDCYDPIEKLCKDQGYVQKIKGAVIGATVGAVSGALIGALSLDATGAATYAAMGAIAGAIGGYFTARLMMITDRNKLMEEYQKILGENSKDWDFNRASVEKAYRCYRKQIAMLTGAAKAKKISKEEFLARMNEVKAGIENINTYWADSQTGMDARFADGESFLKAQEKSDKKLLAGKELRQAEQDVQKMRSSAKQHKNKIHGEFALVDKVKERTEKEYQDAIAFAKFTSNWA